MLYFFDEYVLDTDRRELRRGDRLISVEPKVFDLLAYLIEGRERVVSKEALIAEVWLGRVVSESALASCINAARNAVGDSGESQRLIKTLPRKGLRFVGAVREENSLTAGRHRPPRPRRLGQPLIFRTGHRWQSSPSQISAMTMSNNISQMASLRTSSRALGA
jgi:DNA-binding winged helix-turn-helix (wHTH) protein